MGKKKERKIGVRQVACMARGRLAAEDVTGDSGRFSSRENRAFCSLSLSLLLNLIYSQPLLQTILLYLMDAAPDADEQTLLSPGERIHSKTRLTISHLDHSLDWSHHQVNFRSICCCMTQQTDGDSLTVSQKVK